MKNTEEVMEESCVNNTEESASAMQNNETVERASKTNDDNSTKNEETKVKSSELDKKTVDASTKPNIELGSNADMFGYVPQCTPPQSRILQLLLAPDISYDVKRTLMSRWSIFDAQAIQPDLQHVQSLLSTAEKFDEREDRAIGAFLGMGIGDALGAPLEFLPVTYDTEFVTGMGSEIQGKFRLLPGQWTDDASMGLCIADSLLSTGGTLDPLDCMHRFLAWWFLGYNTPFAVSPRASVGLGGNISQSFSMFIKQGEAATSAGDKNVSGVGSLMRLAAIPVCYHHDMGQALDAARASSVCTHQGEEAAEACRLMAYTMLRLFDCPSKSVLEDLSSFVTTEHSVRCIANSQQEIDPETKKPDPERNWNWRTDKFRFSGYRSETQPGYIGSYALDALAMALHCVWSTDSFAQAVLKAANQRGDADSVAAVTGQLAGALYGARAIPLDWLATLQQWDGGGQFALRAHLLYNRKWISSSIPPRERDPNWKPPVIVGQGNAMPPPPPPSDEKKCLVM